MKISNLLDQQSFNNNANSQFAQDVLKGLRYKPKQIAAKYFYDEKGSILFQKITAHQDYYLTQAEYSILEQIRDKLASTIADDTIDIIELGAGDGHKTRLVIDGFLKQGKQVNLYPVDISEKAMNQLDTTFEPHELLTIHGVVAEYFEGLTYVRKHSRNRQLVLFLGSNIGNFNQLQSQRFLKQLRKIMNNGDYALIGFDLKKDIRKLNAAYNDSAGHTRAFNLNLLERINRELDGEFDIDQFEHYGVYNPIIGAMESFLLSKIQQDVSINKLKHRFSFEKYEPIHLEYSFKYLHSDIENMAREAKFNIVKHYTDTEELFVDSLWVVE